MAWTSGSQFIARYDGDGDLLWVRALSGNAGGEVAVVIEAKRGTRRPGEKMSIRGTGAVLAAAGWICAAPALAWDVQTMATFYNGTGESVTADMHGEVPNTSVYSGGTWSHTSYYSGSAGRGYHLKMTGRTSGKSCLVTVLVRNGGSPVAGFSYMDCKLQAQPTEDGFSCNVDISVDGSQKLCVFTFNAH